MLGVINRRTENAMVEGKKTKQNQSKQTNLQREPPPQKKPMPAPKH
jgi:hypothetical protein